MPQSAERWAYTAEWRRAVLQECDFDMEHKRGDELVMPRIEQAHALSTDEQRLIISTLAKQEEGDLANIFSSKEDRELVSRFIRETRILIFTDYDKAHAQFRPFFLHLVRRLVDRTFKIKFAREAANLTGNDYARIFYKITGFRPRDYLERHRIMLAQRILKNVDARGYQVAYAVGFESQSMFSRSYKKVLGHRPSDEVKSSDISFSVQESVPATSHLSLVDPRVSENTAELTPGLETEVSSRLDDFWETVRSMSPEKMKRYLWKNIDNITLAHYFCLLEKAKYRARTNERKRAEQLARSAMDALNAVRLWTGKAYLDELAIGYATLGNYCKLRFRLAEAEEFFGLATQLLPCDPNEKPLLFARVNYLRVSLLWWQRKTENALRVFNDILPIIRETGSRELLARTLQLGGEIYDCSGHPDRALPLLSEAVKLARYIDDPYVVFSAHFNLTFLYTRMSKASKASAQFQEVKRWRDGANVSSFHIARLGGSVCALNRDFDTAESLFLEAVEGFLSEGPDIYAALALLELSLLYLEVGKDEKAFSAASSSIPAIAKHSCHREAVTALAVLQESLDHKVIKKGILRKALHHLEMVRKDPVANFSVSAS